MSIHQIDLGSYIKSAQIEKYKGAANVQDYVSFASKKIIGVQYHYSPEVGYFYCFKGECCEECGLAATRYILPLIQYTFQSRTEFGAPVYLKYLSQGEKDYNALVLKEELGKELDKTDFLVTCTDATYNSLTFEDVGPAKWRSDPTIKNAVAGMVKEYQSLIGLSVARKLTAEQMYDSIDSKRGQTKKPARGSYSRNQVETHQAPPSRSITPLKREVLSQSKQRPQIVDGNTITTQVEINEVNPGDFDELFS